MSDEMPPPGTLAGDMARFRLALRDAYSAWLKDWRTTVGVVVACWLFIVAVVVIQHYV